MASNVHGTPPVNALASASEADAEASVIRIPKWKPSTHELLIILTLSVVSLMVSLDASIILTSLTAIVVDLQTDATKGFWVGTSYLLANAVSMPFIAALSDIFGRPLCLTVALVIFSIGTIVCCTAQNITALLVGRSVQGIGGGGIMVSSLVVFADIVPLRYRPQWYGAILGAWAFGTIGGPLIGGAIAQNTTWRWIFYIMFPFIGFGFVAIPGLLTLKPRTSTLGEKLARVDWIGGFIFIASATLFLVAISWGGTQFPWSSAQTIAPLVIGLVGLGIAIVWEAYFAQVPFLRRALFHDFASTAAFLCGSAQGLILFGEFYYISLFFMAVKQFSPLHTGLALLPALVFMLPGSVISGRLVTRFNSYRWAIWSGWIIGTIGAGLTTAWNVDTSIAFWIVTLIILGFGQGIILNAQNFATQAQCKPGDEAAAAAMYGFMRQLGSAIGVGIGSSIFQNVMALKLGWQGLDTSIAHDSESYIAELASLPDSDPFKSQVIDAYNFGLKGVFWAFLALSGTAFFTSLLIKHCDMNKEIDSEHKLHENLFAKWFPTTPTNATSSAVEGSADSSAESPRELHVNDMKR